MQPIWTPNPNTLSQTHLYQFMQVVGIDDYQQLYQWSIHHPSEFWKALATFCQIKLSQPSSQIMQIHPTMQKTKWFVDAKMNFAENLLWKDSVQPALIYANEHGERAKISYAALCTRTRALAKKLQSLDVKAGDCIAGLVTNRIETVIAMLATTSIGAIWTACGPEFGVEALIDRFAQIEPVVLFAVTEHCYHGKQFTHHHTIKQLQEKIPSIQQVIFLEEIVGAQSQRNTNPHLNTTSISPAFSETFPFDHPLYILYTSGTTGKPKCIVHGAGNVLLQHKKELMLHIDLHENDTIFFYTTCSWMMWHWMISSLSVGATIILFDGSPFYPSNTTLLDLIDEWDISIFGCGAKIIETYLKNNIKPKQSYQFKKLKTVCATGSPLLMECFDYLYRDVKSDMRVSSIAGGTDIISCFALGNPLLPVYTGELQCRGLGMAVEIFDEYGKSVVNQPGELVCTKPFPTMPIYFWNDSSGEKYYHAYFDRFKNVWAHGDYAKITDHNGLIIYGRSDATLNPGGIRIGTADIYQQALKIPDVLDCVAVGKQSHGDEEIILFVTLTAHKKLDEKLVSDIKTMIRQNTTPHHVPKKIFQVTNIPKTLNGKTMEIAVKNIINGREIKNTETLLNPECLTEYQQYANALMIRES